MTFYIHLFTFIESSHFFEIQSRKLITTTLNHQIKWLKIQQRFVLLELCLDRSKSAHHFLVQPRHDPLRKPVFSALSSVFVAELNRVTEHMQVRVDQLYQLLQEKGHRMLHLKATFLRALKHNSHLPFIHLRVRRAVTVNKVRNLLIAQRFGYKYVDIPQAFRPPRKRYLMQLDSGLHLGLFVLFDESCRETK